MNDRGVPASEATSSDFIMVRAALVRRLGGANEALVWTRIDYKVTGKNPPHVDVLGVAWWPASRDELADETGLSPDQAKRAVTSLLAGGFIEQTEHRIGGNYDRTKSYRTVVIGRDDPPLGEIAQSTGRNRQQERADSPNVPISQTVEDIYAESFPRFWSLWPRSDAKKSARAAWAKAVTRAGGDLPILEGVRRYLATNPDPRYVPYAATWLNGDRWEDELASVAAAGRDDGSVDLTTKWGAGNEWMEHAR